LTDGSSEQVFRRNLEVAGLQRQPSVPASRLLRVLTNIKAKGYRTLW
jgi:hypothetical protein